MTDTATGAQSVPNRWLPVVGGVLLNIVLGTFYAWSVFVLPLEKEFGWVRAQTSWTFSIGVFSIAFWFVVAGRLQDTRGPRSIAALGGLLFSLGFFLASMTKSLPWLYIGFGAMVGAGNGFGYAVPIPVVSKWFPDKRGLALGIVIGGYGLGSGIFGPIAGRLIQEIGWRATFRSYGVLFLVITMVGASLLRNPPRGYHPRGFNAAAQAKALVERSKRDIPTGEMLRSRNFYLLWLAYFFGSMAGLILISQLVPFATQAGIGSVALIALVVGASGNTSGRILSGWMSDVFGRLNVLRLMILISAVAMPLLYVFSGNVVAFAVGVFVVYYCFGTLLAVFAATAADFYGTKYLGMNYGLLFLAWGVSALFAPPIAGRLYDTFGNYQYAFFCAAGLSVVALISLMLAKTPRNEPPPASGLVGET
jgi:MFS transporter, OFA family, oxalate/formate antiporter